MKVSIFKNDVVVSRPLSWQQKLAHAGSSAFEHGVRGEISEFTKASRKRLAFVAANTDVLFTKMITLTYGREYPGDGKTVKKSLQAFIKRLKRAHEPFDYLWFLEFQKRGAPHVHILVDIVEFIDYEKVARDWNQIVGGDDDHLRAGTRVEKLRKPGGRYAVKYAMKMYQKEVPEKFRNVGRFWGNSIRVAPSPRDVIEMNESMLIVALGEDRPACNKVAAQYRVLYGESEKLMRNLRATGDSHLD